jgi:hypothetical protein
MVSHVDFGAILTLFVFLDFKFLFRGILSVIIAFFALVNDVLLHDVLLEFTHLLRIQIKAHLLSSCYQVRVDRRVTIDLLLFLLVSFLEHLMMIFSKLIVVLLVVVATWLSLVDNLLDFLVSFISFSHHSLLCHLKWILVLLLILVIVFIHFLSIG